MQIAKKNVSKKEAISKSLVSKPDSIYSHKVFSKDLEMEPCFCVNENAFAELWNNQHPLIHTWLILTSISICCLSALLFIIH